MEYLARKGRGIPFIDTQTMTEETGVTEDGVTISEYDSDYYKVVDTIWMDYASAFDTADFTININTMAGDAALEFDEAGADGVPEPKAVFDWVDPNPQSNHVTGIITSLGSCILRTDSDEADVINIVGRNAAAGDNYKDDTNAVDLTISVKGRKVDADAFW